MYPESEEIKEQIKKYREILTTSIQVDNEVRCEEEVSHQNEGGEKDIETGQMGFEGPSFSFGMTNEFNQLDDELDEVNKLNEKLEEVQSREQNEQSKKNEAEIKPQRTKHTADVLKSPYLVREVDIIKALSKEEQRIWDYLNEGSKVQK